MSEAERMSHVPIAPPALLQASRRRVSAQPSEDLDEDFLNKVKSYLECRSRSVEPAPSLVDAWNSFYDAYAPRIKRFLAHWGLAEEDRSDCFQEVWKEVIVKLAHFQHDPTRGCLGTWLMTLARNKAIDSIRRRSHQLPECLGRDGAAALLDPNPDPGAEYERRRTQALVRSVLGELSGQVSQLSFQVLYLRWIESRPTSEIAAALELTPDQVRVRICRMKRKFRALFERSQDQRSSEILPRAARK